MAVTITVTKKESVGSLFKVYGTFTSAKGDQTLTLNNAVHGLNRVVDFGVLLTGVFEPTQPKITNSTGTLTAVWQDTLGASGTWAVEGS